MHGEREQAFAQQCVDDPQARAVFLARTQAWIDQYCADTLRRYITDLLTAPELAEFDIEDVEEMIEQARESTTLGRVLFMAEVEAHLDEWVRDKAPLPKAT